MEKLEPATMSDYQRLKVELIRCIDDILGIGAMRGCPCEELREKIETNTFNLVVVGQFKRGKTSLINALLGEDILPVAVVPLTSVVTIMKYGDALRIVVHFNEGRVAEIKTESLPEYVTERGNPKNEKDVSEVIINYPSPYLRGGVQIIDTPGVGSVYEHNTDVAYRYLPKSDAALFLLSVDQPLSKAELEFLKDVREYSKRIFFLLNKADYFCEADLRESMEFSKNVLKEAMVTDIRIFPVSAKLALEGKLSGAEDIVEKSLLPQFSEVLNTFLMEEKGKILILSVTNNLLRLLSQARFELELEIKSLTTPLEELKEKIQTFEERKKEVLTEKSDFDLLLDGEIKKIMKNVLDEDLNAYGQELRLKAEANLDEYYRENTGLSLKELHKHLEEHIISEVRQAVNAWRGTEDEKLAKTFETACKRFIIKIDETVDSLLKFSSELFAVPYDAVKAEALWSTKSKLYYKFTEQPVGLEIITSSLTLSLPKFIGEKIIIRKMKEYLHRVITIQLCRIGSDFEKRLTKSKLDFRWEMLQRIEATIEGIGAAIKKGMSQRSKSEKGANERKNEVSDILTRLDAIKDRLMKLREALGVISRF
ncbi:MAG TPA: dynamin family protein [Thermodesulfovibrionales bacterium]|nr:dynamin family protein [Thermodesulfovibrionales bacterium]